MEPALSLLLESAVEGANGMGETMTTGEDWFPLVLLDGGQTLTIVALPPQLFETDASKNALAYGVFPYLSHRAGAKAICLVSSSWIRTQQDGFEDSKRTEALVLVAATKTQTAMQTGHIVREGDGPPRLLWDEPTVSDPDHEIGGRFAEALRLALDPDPSQWEGIELDLEELP